MFEAIVTCNIFKTHATELSSIIVH